MARWSQRRSGPLPDFAFEAEATTLINAMIAAGTTPNARRQYWINRTILRMKNYGVWTKLTVLYMPGDVEAHWLINWKNPGTFNLTKAGSPTFTANQGVSAAANTDYYDTGCPLSTFSRDDCHISSYVGVRGSAAGNVDCGAQNASSQGLALGMWNASSLFSAKCMTTSQSVGSTMNGKEFHWASRRASGTFAAGHLGIRLGMPVAASIDLTASALNLYILKANGSTTFSAHQISMFSAGSGMTDAEMANFHAAVKVFVDVAKWGDVEVHEGGYAPRAVNADLVVYGTTTQGIVAAFSAMRLGLSVVIVGGWRDHPGNLGGMSGNGLGMTDFNNHASIGGIPRALIQWLNDLDNGGSMSTFEFNTLHMQWRLRQMLDGARSGGQTVPIYYTGLANGTPGGVIRVQKSGTRITSFSTADGRTFTGRYFMDASYEGDLAYQAGCTMVTGREASGSSGEASNGWRGISTLGNTSAGQMEHANVAYDVDPWIIPGDTTSGRIARVDANPGTAIGTADNGTQSYNFRMAWSNAIYKRVPFSTTPPTGYSAATYEVILRFFDTLTGLSLTPLFLDMVKTDQLYDNVFDINTKTGFSTDYAGGSIAYVAAASYTAREVIWQEHRDYTLGLLYLLSNETDSRVTAAVKATAAGWGLAGDHFLDPHPNDPLYWPQQLYIREFRRLVGDLVWDGNDLGATDGGAPRSIKTIAVASYNLDSHLSHRFAWNYSGSSWKVWMSGGFNFTSGGVDETAPLPIEIFLPKAAEITNLGVPFCASSTHCAFGSIRMELTSTQAAESLAYAVYQATQNSDQNLQSIDYPTLRTALGVTPEAVQPVLPQVN